MGKKGRSARALAADSKKNFRILFCVPDRQWALHSLLLSNGLCSIRQVDHIVGLRVVHTLKAKKRLH
jgi:hypothetical protein